MFKSFRTIISALFASILLLSSTTGSFAIDKLHFVIGGGAGGGHDKACGAVVPKDKIKKFVREMNLRLSKK